MVVPVIDRSSTPNHPDYRVLLESLVYDSNTLVRSWIRGVEFTITPRVVAKALGVPVV